MALSKDFRLKKFWSSKQRLVSLSQREKESCSSFVYSRLIKVARSLVRPSSALTDTFFALRYTWSTLKVIKEPRLWNLERLGLESWDYHILAVWPPAAYWGSLSFCFFQYKMGSIRPTLQGISMMMQDTCSVNRAVNCIIYPWSLPFWHQGLIVWKRLSFFSHGLQVGGWSGDDSHTLHLLYMSFLT